MNKKNSYSPDLSFDNLGKVPPQAIELEEAVLGAIILEGSCIDVISTILKPAAFYREAHQIIYSAILDLYQHHKPIDLLTVSDRLSDNGQLDEIGGATYIVSLTQKVASAAHVEYHAKIIAQKFIQRELIRLSGEIQRDAFDGTLDVQDVLDTAQQRMFDVANNSSDNDPVSARDALKNALEIIEDAAKEGKSITGIPSGFTQLDRMLSGFQNSDLIIIGARSSMGKTSFAVNIAANIALNQKIPTAFFSLEMSTNQLMNRIISSESGISSATLRNGRLSSDNWDSIENCLDKISNAPLYIDDTPSLTVTSFRSKLRKLVSKNGVKVAFIDYLQLMSGSAESKKVREQEISYIVNSVKAIAKELNIPIIALAQVGRDVEKSGDKRPKLSQLRESSAIENTSDIVLFIYRPEYYGIKEDEMGESLEGVAEIIVAKHRNGAVGDFRLRFGKETTTFSDIQEEFTSIQAASTLSSFDNIKDNFDGNNSRV